MILMLLSVIMSGNPDLIIVTNDNLQSNIIRQELTTDWSNKPGPVNLNTWRLNQVRQLISEKVNIHIVDIDDHKETEQFRVKRLLHYPQYKWGIYSQEYLKFDERMFSSSSIPLLSIYSLVKEYSFRDDYKAWEEKCSELRSKHYFNRLRELWYFAKNQAVDDIYNYFGYIPETEADLENSDELYGINIDTFIDKYGHLKGFPVEKPLVLPRKPECYFPWEMYYESDSEIGIQKTYYTSVFPPN